MHVRSSVKKWGATPHRALKMTEGDMVLVPAVRPAGRAQRSGVILAVRTPKIRAHRRTTPSSGRE